MTPLSIILDGQNAWPDLGEDTRAGAIAAAALLPNGTSGGRPSVGLRIQMDDGEVIIAQTTARLFCMAAKAFMAAHPDLFEGE